MSDCKPTPGAAQEITAGISQRDSLPEVKAIVLTWDRHRVITEHMILQYARLWPDHPFTFRIPFQNLCGAEAPRQEYIQTPLGIPETVLQLVADLDEEEWVYWCADDKYPIALVIDKMTELFHEIRAAPDISGLLLCRCRITLDQPEASLFPGERKLAGGEVLLKRRRWYQIWIHQWLRVKVLRHFFRSMPRDFPNAKVMDQLKNQISKPDDMRLFVTKENYAVFGESTQRGMITRNCYESVGRSQLELPAWFQQSNNKVVTMGELKRGERSRWQKLANVMRQK